jgi:hypothetical protein
MTLIVKPGFNGMTDTDAIAYVNAVEAADGQLLEFGVGKAINDFVVGCKLDGTWSAIKASCILAGARTLAGALVPLAGTAPTNVGPFVSGDYNRKTGLVGDGTSKYLNSNRNSNADPQNNAHTSIYVSVARTNSSVYIGCDPAERSSIYALDGNNIGFSLRQASPSYSSAALTTTGFIGQSRSISTSIQGRVASTGTTFSVSSTGFGSGNYLVFARLNSGVLASVTNARLAFYSIGESLDLAALDARVSALITAFGVAIP